MKKYILQLFKSMTFGVALVLGSILGLVGVYAALNWDGLTANVQSDTPLTKDLWNNTIGKLKANIDALDTRVAILEGKWEYAEKDLEPCLKMKSVTGGYEVSYQKQKYCDADELAIKTATSITIPSSYNGKPVVAIDGFRGTNLTSVVIPSSVKTIGENAFSNSKLTRITIPSSVISIGNGAFSSSKLTNVTIPNGVVNIGENAFSNNQLVNVTIPNSVTSIGENAFKPVKKLVLGNGVKTIGNSMFANYGLTNVTIPNGVVSIGNNAFMRNNLTNITIPNTVKTIGSYAFGGNKLTSVVIPNSVTTLGYSPFSPVKNLVIGSGITRSIDEYEFDGAGLESVTIPSSIKNIGVYAFSNNNITSVTLSSSTSYCKAGRYGKDDYSEGSFDSTVSVSGGTPKIDSDCDENK